MISFLTALLADDNKEVEMLSHLYERHYKLWQYKVRAIIRDNEADDIIQEVFATMMAKLSFLNGLSPSRRLAYISRCIENAAKKTANFRDRVIVTDDIEQYALEMADDPATIYDQKATNEELFRAIERLDERKQDLIFYKYFEELSDETIATLLDMQSQSIRSALTRARQGLRAELDKGRKNGKAAHRSK